MKLVAKTKQTIDVVDNIVCSKYTFPRIIKREIIKPLQLYVNEKIQAYPNPFKEMLNLKIQNQENKELLVRVVDRYGLSVYEAKHLVINNLVTLDLSKLENDYYFIVIGKQTFKVIKQ